MNDYERPIYKQKEQWVLYTNKHGQSAAIRKDQIIHFRIIFHGIETYELIAATRSQGDITLRKDTRDLCEKRRNFIIETKNEMIL